MIFMALSQLVAVWLIRKAHSVVLQTCNCICSLRGHMEKESGHGSVGMADLPVLVITVCTCAAGVKQSTAAQTNTIKAWRTANYG